MKSADVAYEALQTGILNGTTEQGAWLREEEVAESLKLSRRPVREALRRLEADGLIDVLPHRGARVRLWSSRDLTDIYDLRVVLDGTAAEWAAKSIDEAAVCRLRVLCDEMEAMEEAIIGREAAGGRSDFSRLNNEFHGLVRQAAGSAVLLGVLQGVVQVPLVLHTFHRYGTADMRRSISQHRDLVEALRTRDGAWANAIMRSHVLAAKSTLVQATAKPGSPGSEPAG